MADRLSNPKTQLSVASGSAPAAQAKMAVAATDKAFSQQLRAYKAWRDELSDAIRAYQSWIEGQGYSDGAEDLRTYELIEEIQSDKLTVALAGEFSRGKTELLNAIFFADFKQRLLPSGAGRTTMCPTELGYNEKEGASIRLLPIETRKTSLAIAEYKHTPIHWTTLHILKPDSADEVRAAFLETTRTKKVHMREAQELGLYDPERNRRQGDAVPADGIVEIPVWRHALINYPHPLLKQGLVILDTPGLNAIGVEPELTLSMLPSAQVVLFVLGADTGVTQSDFSIWTNHVRKTRRSGVFVALNKIDVLWDELQDTAAVSASIAQQVKSVAQTLQVDAKWVLPISAQKGLVGRIKSDAALIERSGLAQLEERLAQDMIPSRHSLIRDRVVHEMSARVESSYNLVKSKLTANQEQLNQLKQLGNKNLDTIHKLVAHVRLEKQKYDKELEGFQVTRATLTQQANTLLGYMNMQSIDALIEAARNDMQDSWTTHGLQSGMTAFFRGAAQRMQQANQCADDIRKAVEQIYDRLHTEYGMSVIKPPALSLIASHLEFKRLEEKAEIFRTSPATMMTEQHFVIKKFFITLASQARQTFHECNESAKNWFKVAVSPVFAQVQQHRAAIERKLEMLKKIQQNLDSLNEYTATHERERLDLEAQLHTARQLLERIQQPFHSIPA
jgi:hypothetical protein